MQSLTFILAIAFILPFENVLADSNSTSIYETLLSSPSTLGIKSWSPDLVSQFRQLKDRAVAGNFSKCQNACSLASVLLSNVSSSSSLSYQPIPYWSVQQSQVTPACRIDVSSALDISKTIQLSKITQCPFAVRSGGHASWAGGSSIEGGILINLKNLNEVSLNTENSVARVGPGNTWFDVYKVLDPQGVSVVGGREAGVGVGGLLLGGGISYFSGRYGWGCDNAVKYEVVLADGSIVNASPYENKDLYWALRGGSGTNFGIVSRFDLAAFEQGELWGGTRFYTWDHNSELVDAFAKFEDDAPTDSYAHLYISFGYNALLGGFAGISGPTHSKAIANASIFSTLNNITSFASTTQVASMADLSVALNQTDFLREAFKTVTIKSNPALMKEVVNIFQEEATNVLNVTGLNPFFAFQPLSIDIIEHMQKNGGNVLGLKPEDGPLTILSLNWGWTNEADDSRVHAALDSFISRSVDLSKSMGLDHSFIYMNYAALEQDVFAGYGASNLARLRGIRHKYDPTGVFKKLQPGYFKL